jgi:hypothetical protein
MFQCVILSLWDREKEQEREREREKNHTQKEMSE